MKLTVSQVLVFSVQHYGCSRVKMSLCQYLSSEKSEKSVDAFLDIIQFACSTTNEK